MPERYSIIMLGCQADAALHQKLHIDFDVTDVNSSIDCLKTLATRQYKLVLIDLGLLIPSLAFELCRSIRTQSDIPVILVTEEEAQSERLQAYDCGVDDYLAMADLSSKLHRRLEYLIVNKIANDQLKVQLEQANEMAFVAMKDTSDLGVNIHFFLESNSCNNLDELGMCFFQALNNYGLRSSLQMRSEYGVKNMEANGMEKPLESRLLSEMKGEGRYVDFSQRSVMNYGSVSLLVKNMPLDDEKKYGAIKDNVFSLLQGADARIQSLDNLKSLSIEKDLVKEMVDKMKAVMASVDANYQNVMRDIAGVVEEMADGVEHSIQFLGMDEHQERTLQLTMQRGIDSTTDIFSKGLEVDEELQHFLAKMDGAFQPQSIEAEELQGLIKSIGSF